MNMKCKDLDFLQAELTRTSEWVQFADKKAGFVAVFYSAIFGLLIAQRDEIFSRLFWHHHMNCSYALMLFLLIVALIIGAYFLFATVSPRLKNGNTARSLFYFGTVANMKIEDYLKDIEEMTDDEARRQVAEQIHSTSVIADMKMSNVRKSTLILLVCGALVFCLFFL